jgi:membrane protease YdiL (CAAX protease family)
MTAECVLLSLPLIVLSLIINRPATANWAVAQGAASAAAGAVQTGGTKLWADIVTGIGAGIYEELVFRLILISALMILLQDLLRMDKAAAVVFSVLISSFLFSVHHHFFYANGGLGIGEAFAWSKFIFRMLAGVYFAALYAVRGFGIAAGTHAFYDILATLLNAMFFPGAEG